MKRIFPILLCLTLVSLGQNFAQNLFDPSKPSAATLKKLGRSQPLRDLSLIAAPTGLRRKKQEAREEIQNFPGREKIAGAGDRSGPGPDGALQTTFNLNGSPIQLEVNVDGIDFDISSVAPPDVAGVVGHNYFIQMINANEGAKFIVLDKKGQHVHGPADLNALWQDLGTSSYGDPIILYDQEKKRWLLSEISNPFDGSNKMLMAVSVTEDPLGQWEGYQAQAPDVPDYPKYAIWNDAVFITTNEPSSDKIPVYAVNREQLFGLAPTVQIQRIEAMAKYTDDFNIGLPVEWDGPTPPPANSPLIAFRVTNDGSNDRIELNEITVDWANAGNTKVSPSINIPIANLNFHDCDQGDCITLPGAGTGLDVLSGVPMYRASYRNFGTHEAIVANVSVDAGAGKGGIRWFELRRQPGGAWELHQEGTFAPDASHRWMASLAMDAGGNIALGYSVAGENLPPSLAVIARYREDPAGALTFTETSLVKGMAMPEGGSRWGDYFTMTVDPSDDKTFWFTGEYLKGANDDWGTRIAAFKIKRDSVDMAASALLSPADSPDLTASEPVKIQVTNQGIKPVDNFQVGYIFGNNPPVTADISQPLATGETYEHTFPGTADLAAFGPYAFKVFTNVAGDQTPFNDTLPVTVHHLTRNDAGVQALAGADLPLCISAEKLRLVLRNFSGLPLTGAQLNWTLNNGAPHTETLNLNLAPGATQTVEINVAGLLQPGNNSLSAYTELPNGQTDDNPANDTLQTTVAVLTQGETVRIEFTTDNAPGESKWRLFDAQFNTVAESQPMTEAQHTYVTEVCLDPGECYRLQVQDEGQDGLTAGTPPGDVTVKNSAGQVLYKLFSPAFAFGFEANICPANTDCGTLTGQISVYLDFITNNAVIACQGSGGTPPYEFSIHDTGNDFSSDPIYEEKPLTDFPSGSGRIRDANGCEQFASIDFQACPIDISTTVVNTPPGQSLGSIKIQAAGIPGFQFKYSLDFGPYGSSNTFTGLAAGEHLACVGTTDFDCRNCVIAIVETTTAVHEDLPDGVRVSLSPNPTEGRFRLEIAGTDAATDRLPFFLFDAAGRTVRRGELTRWSDVLVATHDISTLPTGAYFIKTTLGSSPVVLKLMKSE